MTDITNPIYNDPDAARAHLEALRWADGRFCPHCGATEGTAEVKGKKRSHRDGLYYCNDCKKQFTVTVGTIFERSKVPLHKWVLAYQLMASSKKGMSAHQLHRMLGVTYKTAWRMGQQIRQLMAKADGFEMLRGHIELDEAYVGGKRSGGKRGRGAEGKTIVFGMKEREGRMTTEIIPNVKKVTLREATLRNVEPGSTVSTDELMSYGLLDGDGYKHGSVKHGAKEWSYYDYRHDAFHHVNHVESFWKLFKASIRSTHVHISAKYMDRYLKEFTFRSNHREKQNAMFDLLVGAV
ncbi:MAG: IS1595 family transposase [Rhodospirillales bacterium]